MIRIGLFSLAFICLILRPCFSEETFSLDHSDFIKFHWKGAVTSHSITFKIFPTDKLVQSEGLNTFFALYTKHANSSLDSLDIIQVKFTGEEYPVSELFIDELSPSTQYYYSFAFNKSSELDLSLFKQAKLTSEFGFKTFNKGLTPMNFTFGAASCARSGSNSSVFLELHKKKLDFFIQTGDLHYDDIETNNVSLFYQAYNKVFSSPNQKLFYENTPITYVWDDHDFGPNDAIGTSASKPAATEAYKNFVPSYSLKNILPDDDSIEYLKEAANWTTNATSSPFGIFRSFVVGRCLFIVMDLRSFLEVEPKDIMGQEQKEWMENQIKYAGRTSEIKMVFLVSSIVWIENGGPTFEEIKWAAHRKTQAFIVDLIEKHVKSAGKNIMMVSGDAHMLAFDDGRNNNYGGFPVLQAASLDKSTNCKGGPYSHGAFPGTNQFGVVEVVDYMNQTICVKINLIRGNTTLIGYDTCHPEHYPSSGNAKCHPTWEDFTWMMVIASIVGGVIVWSIRNHLRKSKEKKRYEVLEQNGADVEGISQGSELAEMTKRRTNKND